MIWYMGTFFSFTHWASSSFLYINMKWCKQIYVWSNRVTFWVAAFSEVHQESIQNLFLGVVNTYEIVSIKFSHMHGKVLSADLFCYFYRFWQRSMVFHGRNCLAWQISSQHWKQVWMRWLPLWRTSYMKNHTPRKRWDSSLTLLLIKLGTKVSDIGP